MSAKHQESNNNLSQPQNLGKRYPNDRHSKAIAKVLGNFVIKIGFLSLGLGLIVSCQTESSQKASDASKQNSAATPEVTIGSQETAIIPPSTTESIKPNRESSSSSAKKQPEVAVPVVPPLPPRSQNNASNPNSQDRNFSGQNTENLPVNPQPSNEFPLPAPTSEESVPKQANNKFNKYAEYGRKPRGQNTYQNKQLGFSFKYPKGYIVGKSQANFGAKPGVSKQKLDVWTDEDYQAIKAGKFRGTELPASVSISVEKNPKGLDAQQWLQENADEFGSTANQTTRLVAGQKAMAFNTADLYESENVVLPTKDNSNIIIISLAQNRNNLDKEYKQAFEKVISSFNLRN